MEDGSGSFTNWTPGRPYEDEGWNCMMMSPFDGTWYDYPCDNGNYAVCSKPTASATAAARAHNDPPARNASSSTTSVIKTPRGFEEE